MRTNANDFDRLAMQGEDTGVDEADVRHEITMLTDATKKEREQVLYAAACSCGWHSRWYVLPSASMHAANEHEGWV